MNSMDEVIDEYLSSLRAVATVQVCVPKEAEDTWTTHTSPESSAQLDVM
jgi:hypothetical protein